MSTSPYFPAAQLLKEIWTTKKSLKTLAYDPKGKLKCNKATYAQVCHVLESKTILDLTLERTPGQGVKQLKKNARHLGLLYVLLYELLLGPNKKIRGGGALKREIVSIENDMRSALKVVMKTHKIAKKFVVPLFPRYVRVNTLQKNSTLEQVVKAITDVSKDINIPMDQIYVDSDVPNVLVLPPTTSLAGHELVQSGKAVLQDKSSCFSALCMVHGGGSSVPQGDFLDACAAPGNKTSHLAALVAFAADSGGAKSNKNKKPKKTTVYALDRSSDRLKLLKRRMGQLIPDNHSHVQVTPEHKDFLRTDPADAQYKSLKGILLDPSCSGSGIFTSPDRASEQEAAAAAASSKNSKKDADDVESFQSRIQSLSNFQLVALKHAMSFPQVERIVYSTCSLHEQENEKVVAQAIEAFSTEWQIIAPACLQNWKRRGRIVEGLTEEQSKCLIRADREDDTNGFFVCYFERMSGTKKGGKGVAVVQKEPSNDLRVLPEGMAFYNREFAAIAGNNLVEDKDLDDADDLVSEVDEQTRPKSGTTSSEKPSRKKNGREDKKKELSKNKNKNSTPSGKSDDKIVSKKRAKKLAWKKR